MVKIIVLAPTKQEIKKAIQSMRTGRAQGIDQVTAEMIKADLDGSCKELKQILDRIWQEKRVPDQWKQGLIFKISKKGNLQDWGN